MARKCKKLAVIGRRRISLIWTNEDGCDSLNLADEGCFVIYSIDMRRFMVPLACLSRLPSDGPIIMPCDSALLENIVMLIRRGESETSEKVLFDAVNSNRSLFSSSCDEATIQQLAIPVC
ncbi:hypothetical protein ACJRO7_027889 [Eucalyptus globulus]|uniref:Uncharacterized protein n=1 Tax=Eucalyptus globulus TaxID=34317 RepID=A0ABD3JV60_EUCGL